MNDYKIAVIKGDGIGPEIVDSALKVLYAVQDKFGFKVTCEEYLAGGCAIDVTGKPLPEETLEGCKNSDAVLLGAVGGPRWDGIEPSLRPERALLGLRSGLGLYANLRPAIMFEELKDASPVKNIDHMDIMMVRELTGGIYFGDSDSYSCNDILSDGTPKVRIAYDTESYSEGEIRRITDLAFRIARGRNKHLTLVDKANVLTSSRLWREIAEDVHENYRDVSLDYLYVDNCSMQLISRPGDFDTIVTSNMFGDILSDEAGQITGSVGMLPSASLGKPGSPGLYEPIHGSAPDIAGTGKANPLATILSVALMLRWQFGETEAADSIENAVKQALASGYRTSDIARGNADENPVDTAGMTAAVIAGI